MRMSKFRPPIINYISSWSLMTFTKAILKSSHYSAAKEGLAKSVNLINAVSGYSDVAEMKCETEKWRELEAVKTPRHTSHNPRNNQDVQNHYSLRCHRQPGRKCHQFDSSWPGAVQDLQDTSSNPWSDEGIWNKAQGERNWSRERRSKWCWEHHRCYQRCRCRVRCNQLYVIGLMYIADFTRLGYYGSRCRAQAR